MQQDVELDAMMTFAARKGVLDVLCHAKGLSMSYALARGHWYLSQPQEYRERVRARAAVLEAQSEVEFHKLTGGQLH